jgi:hypothetical protein
MIALGWLAQSVFGANTIVSGLITAATSPPSMTVNVGPGMITSVQDLEANAFGSLSADTSDNLLKMGINATGVTPFALTAPGTSGQSINYLIEAAFQESDAGSIVLPYWNSSNPNAPFSGPNNSGTSQNTQRIQRVVLTAKAGTAATTGSQTTPAADAGNVPLAVVTVAYGATTITSGNISVHPSSPAILYNLQQLLPRVPSQKVFTSNGTLVVPNGVTEIAVTGCAGGAGGNGFYSGGAGQSTFKQIISVTPGATLTLGIGGGGAGTQNTTAGSGGNTTIVQNGTTLLTLQGAVGSGASTWGTPGYPEGSNSSNGSTNPGASSPFGGGGGAGGTVSGTQGGNASGYGAGGGQGQTEIGGNGTQGILMLEW